MGSKQKVIQKQIKIVLRNRKGQFCKPHAQKYIRHEIYIKGKMVFAESYRKGVDRIESSLRKMHYRTALKTKRELLFDIKLRKSIVQSIEPYAKLLEKYSFLDVTIYKDKKIILRIAKIPVENLPKLKVRGRYTGRLRKERAVDRLRREIKFALQLKGYAVTPKQVRKATRAVKMKGLKQVYFSMKVWGYKKFIERKFPKDFQFIPDVTKGL